MSDLDLSIIIPAFNDAHKFGADVEAADRFLEQESLRGEIILVSDGSVDDTIERAHALQELHPPFGSSLMRRIAERVSLSRKA